MSLCKSCPHRKISEGGGIPDGQVPRVRLTVANKDTLVLTGRLIHPCHSDLTKDCEGHLRDFKQGRGSPECENIRVEFSM
jgi:hypothetical protein